jgi:hypothetical protein
MRIPIPRTRTGRAAALAIALGALLPLIALSVNNSSIFELEGDASDGAAQGDDWQNIADDRTGGPGTIAQNNSLVSTFLTDGLDASDFGSPAAAPRTSTTSPNGRTRCRRCRR